MLTACACSSPTLPTSTVIVPAPTLTCPVPPSPVQAGNGQSASVTYGAPLVTGGTAPVSVTCTPPTGSTFNVGSTSVACTATDAVQRTATCAFAITVVPPPPRLSETNFLAFGDSITAGEIPDCTDTACPAVVQSALAYPADLQALLSQRYTAQTITITNDGLSDETAVGGMARLPGQLAMYHPGVLLLLESVNDLDPSNATSSIQSALSALQAMIQDAQGQGVRVLISTLLPEVPVSGPGNRAKSVNLIAPFNALLKPMAVSQGAIVVDMYSAFENGDLSAWISPLDGLHPTAAGYQEMAQVFFTAIKTNFALSLSATAAIHLSGPSRVPPHVAVRPTER
jgi:lysophospholipase L1-like esterase